MLRIIMSNKTDKFFKWALCLFCIGRGLSILESVGLLIFDALSNYDEVFYGYESWQTVVFLLISVALTTLVIVFAAILRKKEKSQKSVKAAAITLIASDVVMLLHLTYGVLSNMLSDITVNSLASLMAFVVFLSGALLLTLVSGDLLSIIGAAMLLRYGFKKAK